MLLSICRGRVMRSRTCISWKSCLEFHDGTFDQSSQEPLGGFGSKRQEQGSANSARDVALTVLPAVCPPGEWEPVRRSCLRAIFPQALGTRRESLRDPCLSRASPHETFTDFGLERGLWMTVSVLPDEAGILPAACSNRLPAIP